ncbi:UNVERIFIED_CONTAM: hypothetical protein HDU68_002735 [Siphonaria sp. JEL0065]|nr:hypothetical protein HDU68_002735 [Siphonaria sp. JEL0065]
MGLFSFVVKIGIVAYAIDWVSKREPTSSNPNVRNIENAAANAAQHAKNAAEEATPKVTKWLHDAWANENTSRFSSSDLPNGRVSLEIDVPGIKKEDIQLSVNEHEKVIILNGSTAGNNDQGIKARRVEKRISLPSTSDVSDLKASLENGVLRVNVGKKEFEGRRIVVE